MPEDSNDGAGEQLTIKTSSRLGFSTPHQASSRNVGDFEAPMIPDDEITPISLTPHPSKIKLIRPTGESYNSSASPLSDSDSSISRSLSLSRSKRPADLNLRIPSEAVNDGGNDSPAQMPTPTFTARRERFVNSNGSHSPGQSSAGSPFMRGRASAAGGSYAPRSAGGSPFAAFGSGHRRDFSESYGGHSRNSSHGGRALDTPRGGGRVPSPWQFSKERVGRTVDQEVITNMKEAHERRIEALLRENTTLKMRGEFSDDTIVDKRILTEEDIHKEVENLFEKGDRSYIWAKDDRKGRDHELAEEDQALTERSFTLLNKRATGRANVLAHLNICRARLARSLGLSKELEISARKGSEFAIRADDDALQAKCAFWIGVSLFEQEHWDEAMREFQSSRQAVSILIEDEVDFALQAAEQSQLRQGPYVSVKELGVTKLASDTIGDVGTEAESTMKRLRRRLPDLVKTRKSATHKIFDHWSKSQESPFTRRHSYTNESSTTSRPTSQGLHSKISVSESPRRPSSIHSMSSMSFHRPSSLGDGGRLRPGTPTTAQWRSRGFPAASFTSANSIESVTSDGREANERPRNLGDELAGILNDDSDVD